jgi:hypothetical protein
MHSNQLSSFVKQDREIFRSPKQGPVPDAVLDSLLSEAEAILSQELAQRSPDQKLDGIRLGYRLENPDHSVEIYWAGFGENTLYEKLLKFAELDIDQEVDAQDSISIPSASEGLEAEVINTFIKHIEEVIHAQILDEIDPKNVNAWMFLHTVGYLQPLRSLARSRISSRIFNSIFSPDRSLEVPMSFHANYGCCPSEKKYKILNEDGQLKCNGGDCCP